jgi:hypothetical protein
VTPLLNPQPQTHKPETNPTGSNQRGTERTWPGSRARWRWTRRRARTPAPRRTQQGISAPSWGSAAAASKSSSHRNHTQQNRDTTIPQMGWKQKGPAAGGDGRF